MPCVRAGETSTSTEFRSATWQFRGRSTISEWFNECLRHRHVVLRHRVGPPPERLRRLLADRGAVACATVPQAERRAVARELLRAECLGAAQERLWDVAAVV